MGTPYSSRWLNMVFLDESIDNNIVDKELARVDKKDVPY
jgi:hypothetical protein